MESAPALAILQISDLHILPNLGQTLLGIDTEHYFHEILNHAMALGIAFDLLLVTGDLAQDPCPASYQRILERLEQCPIPAICLPGNHDDLSLMQGILNTDKVSCQKQAMFENWQLICLNSQIPNSPDGELSPQELVFLKHCLLKHPDCHALVAVHHHSLPTGCAWLDTMMIKNSSQLFELIGRFPQVKAITNGHIHQLMDTMVDNVRVLAAPSTCFQFKPNCEDFCVEPTAPGYRTIMLYADGSVSSETFRLAQPLAELELINNGY